MTHVIICMLEGVEMSSA